MKGKGLLVCLEETEPLSDGRIFGQSRKGVTLSNHTDTSGKLWVPVLLQHPLQQEEYALTLLHQSSGQ